MPTSPRTAPSNPLDSFALISHTDPGAAVAWRAGQPITAAQFLADVRHLARALPAGAHVLNVCSDRYRFAVGLGASLVAGKVSLLPPTYTPEVIRQLTVFAPDVFCLTDDAHCDVALPLMPYPAHMPPATSAEPVPRIAAEQLAAYVFTSGSTGVPLPHKKAWGNLVRCVRDGASRLGLLDGTPHNLVATVPPQHMYGFESSVLLAMQTGGALCAERPFYPADVCSALQAVPRPRTLVTTPVHLRALLGTQASPPPLDLVVCATAPLPFDLACEVEEKFAVRLLEIYGSTETGQIATRRTATTQEWQLWPAVTLTAQADDEMWAQGGHIEQPTALCDVIEPTHDDCFLLHGRRADLVNIAGKRSSLAYLNHQLNAIDGVQDGTFFLPDDAHASHTGVARVAAFVVAPGLDAATLMERLRQRIDAVFLPRPLLFVARLPRNSTGKLPQEALRKLAAQHLHPAS